ncbi:hypothetical protein ACWDWU_49640, partial [Streptomyces sp. NPDC003442]
MKTRQRGDESHHFITITARGRDHRRVVDSVLDHRSQRRVRTHLKKRAHTRFRHKRDRIREPDRTTHLIHPVADIDLGQR